MKETLIFINVAASTTIVIDSDYNYTLTAPTAEGLYTLFEFTDYLDRHIGYGWEKQNATIADGKRRFRWNQSPARLFYEDGNPNDKGIEINEIPEYTGVIVV